jgi:putative transcription factor
MSHQDWETVTLKKTHSQKTRGMSQAQAITMGKRDGIIETQKRTTGGGAKAHRLEEHGRGDDDSFVVKKVDKSLSKAIAQARNAKKMTQKQLGAAICENPKIVQDYESGKAIPSGQILAKLDKALGTRLPRPSKK